MKDRTIMNSIDYTGDEDVFFLAYHIIRVNEEKGRYGLSAMKDTAESFIRQYTNDNNGSTVNNIIDNFKNTLDFINVCIDNYVDYEDLKSELNDIVSESDKRMRGDKNKSFER